MILRMIAHEPSYEADMATLLKEYGGTRRSFQRNFLYPAMEEGLVELTIPNKPKSRYQKYILFPFLYHSRLYNPHYYIYSAFYYH